MGVYEDALAENACFVTIAAKTGSDSFASISVVTTDGKQLLKVCMTAEEYGKAILGHTHSLGIIERREKQ